MKRAQQAIAVALVTTALCADGAVASAARAESLRPQPTPSVGRWVQRLSHGFRQAVPAAKLCQSRIDFATPTIVASEPPASDVLPARPPLSPFEFRLPPPRV